MPATAAEKEAAVNLLVEEGVIERGDDDEILTEAQVDKAMAVDNWINDLGGFDDAAIVVYQVDPSSNKMEYIESMGVQEMTGPMLFEKLKNEYGGGKFRIQMRADGAIRKTQTVLIKKVPVKETEPGALGVDLPSLVRELKTDQGSGNTDMLLKMMQHSNEQFQQMISTIVGAMGNNNQPAVDPMAMQASLLSGIQEMQKLAGLNKAEKNPTDLILEGVKLVTAIKSEGEGGEANIYSVLQKALGSFGDTLGAAMTMPPGGIPGAPPVNPALAAPAAGSLAAIADESKIETEGGATLPQGHPLAPFEPFVDWMLGLAQKNANPELYAEVIIDQIGAEAAQQWLATEEGLTTLKEHLPKCVPYENWLRLVGQEITLLIEEGAELGVDETNLNAQNANEPVAQDSDARPGHDSPTANSRPSEEGNQPSIDGNSERTGGDSDNAPIDVEFSESSQDDAPNT